MTTPFIPAMKGFVFSLLAALVLLPGSLTAQEPASTTGAVEGVVLSADGDVPLEGASVEVVGSHRRTLTDARGRFRLSSVPAGEQTIRVALLGYGRTERTVSVVGGEESVLEIPLGTAAVELAPLDILAERTRMVGSAGAADEIPGSAHFLSRADIEERHLPFDNVHDVLRTLPGVNVQDEDGYGLRPNIGLRGTGVERSSRITLMEDGVLIAPAPYASPSAYYFPVVGRMEGIEVRKGSSQIQYGPRTTGGAVNLVSTSIPETLSWTLDLSGGEDATLRGVGRVGDSSENWGWLLETYRIRTDGFKQIEGGGDTGFDVQDYVGKLRINSDRDADVYQELELKLGYTDELSNETYLGLTRSDFASTPLLRYPASRSDVMDAEHSQVQLRYFVRPSERFDLTATAYRNDFARNWYKLGSVRGVGIANVLDEPATHEEELAILQGADSEEGALAVRANNREYYGRGVQAVLGFRDGAGRFTHDLEVGVRFHQDQEDRFQLEDRYQMVDGSMVLTDPGEPGSQANRMSDAEALALYVQDRIRFGRWTVEPGLRYENIDFVRTDYATDDPGRTAPTGVRENGVDVWIPGVGVSYAPREGMRLFGGVHRGFAPPGAGADPETEPEESVNYELGARVRRGGVAAEAVGFFSDYDNILGRATLATGEDGSGDAFNGGAVDVRGVELALDYDPSFGRDLPLRLPIEASYTWTDTEFATSFESAFGPWGTVERADELPYLAEHQYSASAGLEDDVWSLRLSVFGSSAMRTVAGQGAIPEDERVDGFSVWSLGGEYRLLDWGAVFYANVQNLEDERYVVARRPAGARPGLPRTFTTGIRISR